MTQTKKRKPMQAELNFVMILEKAMNKFKEKYKKNKKKTPNK